MKPLFLRAACTAILATVMALAGCGGGASPGAGEAAKADAAPVFTGNGVWWNPAESGSGFFFEAQGATAVVTFYMYEAGGRAVWYTGPGGFAALAGGKFQFDGALQRYTGGQSGKSIAPKQPTGSTPAGTVSITFDGFKAQGTVAGRSFSAQKFFQSGATASAVQPETGIYWNPSEGGRGYTIEVNNNLAVVTAFHYTEDGQALWHLVTVPFTSSASGTASGDFTAFSGGQTLAGPYKAPSSSAVEGRFGLAFSAACEGQLAFPQLPAIAVKRFAFGSLPAGGECRAKGLAGSGSGRADAFTGTWEGCFVASESSSRKEVWVLSKSQTAQGALQFTISYANHATRDCSGPGTPLPGDAGIFDFAPNGSSIIDGVVMHRVFAVGGSTFKRVIGVQTDGRMRVGDQTRITAEDGYADKLSGVEYNRQP